MGIPTLMPDPSTARSERGNGLRRGWWVLFGVGVIAALGLVVGSQAYRREHDRHTLVRRVRVLEGALRAHDPSIVLSVEGRDPPGTRDPVREARHRAMLDDFERLAHLDDFAMTGIRVELRGDVGIVSYRVRGVPRLYRIPGAARGGDPLLQRRARCVFGAPPGGGSSPSTG